MDARFWDGLVCLIRKCISAMNDYVDFTHAPAAAPDNGLRVGVSCPLIHGGFGH